MYPYSSLNNISPAGGGDGRRFDPFAALELPHVLAPTIHVEVQDGSAVRVHGTDGSVCNASDITGTVLQSRAHHADMCQDVNVRNTVQAHEDNLDVLDVMLHSGQGHQGGAYIASVDGECDDVEDHLGGTARRLPSARVVTSNSHVRKGRGRLPGSKNKTRGIGTAEAAAAAMSEGEVQGDAQVLNTSH